MKKWKLMYKIVILDKQLTKQIKNKNKTPQNNNKKTHTIFQNVGHRTLYQHARDICSSIYTLN